MSWQTYVDEHLMCDIEGNHLTASAIVGHDGSVWAQSSSFPKVSIFFKHNNNNNNLLFVTIIADLFVMSNVSM